MTKPVVRVAADGRVGFPRVLLYEIVEGPAAGARVAVPPTADSHPAPGPARWVSTPEPPYAKPVPTRAGCAYVTVILDDAEYQRLADIGFWNSPEHAGAGGVVDNRKAPLA